MSRTSLNTTPRPKVRPATARREAVSHRPGRPRRGRTSRQAASLAAMSERHVAALVREIDMAEVEDAPSMSRMRLDDSLLDPAFDDELAGWGVHGHEPFRPRSARMTAHLGVDDEGWD